MQKLKYLTIATIVLACAQFARCYGTLTIQYLDLNAYANGTGPMPYQGRMLLMWPLRWAQNNAFLLAHTYGREGAFRNPALLVVTALAGLCVLLTCWVVTAMYWRASHSRSLPWLPAALLLVIVAVQYILHSQNVLYPYDLLSLLLFTLGIFLIHTRRVWWLVLLFPVATLNREVTLFLILLLVVDRWRQEGWRGLRRVSVVAQLALMSALWLALHVYAQHRFAGNPTEMGSRLIKNIHNILSPAYWPQLAATGAYLLPFIYVYRKRILDARLRAYLWVLLPWTLMMIFYGEIVETRLFGELSGLIAVTAALAFEESFALQSNPNAPLAQSMIRKSTPP